MERTNFYMFKLNGKIFKFVSESRYCQTFLKDRNGMISLFDNEYLIPIPDHFRAYIKSDSAYHGLNGNYIDLSMEELEESNKNFFNGGKRDEKCLWFFGSNRWIPNVDIDFTTIEIIPKTENKEDPIPPMPTLDELQHCTIEYSGRKTVLTYCDAFVGEAICHPDDEFKVNTGVAYAYSRAKKAKEEYDAEQEEKKKIRVGDIVRVVDAGQNFSSYYEKVAEICQKIDNMYACARYAYEERLFDSEDQHDEFKVLYIDEDYAYIENVDNWKCRLVTPQAICKAELFKKTKINDDIDWGDGDLW